MLNAHLHLDRSGTLAETREILNTSSSGGDSHLSLSDKHALIPKIHASRCYDTDVLAERVDGYLDALVEIGTTRADTVVDTTVDRVGLHALQAFLELKEKRRGMLDLRVGAYSPLGFRDDEPQRFELLVEGTRIADFIGALPERDDHTSYPQHIGFDESCRRMLTLSAEHGKPLHVHVDQRNHPGEAASERVVRAMREIGLSGQSDQEPMIWLVHVISPSTYDDERFNALIEAFVELNIGVICCPSAAISMRQYRPIRTPTANSIARVLEMLAAGVHVRVGSDNICDITSPAGTPDLMHELFVLCNAVRYYDVELLAKLGAGLRPDAADLSKLRAHLDQDRKEIARIARDA
jgi:cytosine/adenosine deaminase-related metal-dependent hydrolase